MLQCLVFVTALADEPALNIFQTPFSSMDEEQISASEFSSDSRASGVEVGL
jgi:hypothetical protein